LDLFSSFWGLFINTFGIVLVCLRIFREYFEKVFEKVFEKFFGKIGGNK